AIASLPHLHDLEANGTKVTDDGLKHVPRMRSLHYLDIENTAVTDKGLAYLAEAKSLEGLRVKGTSVTDAGAAQLKKALPKITIRRDQAKPGRNHRAAHSHVLVSRVYQLQNSSDTVPRSVTPCLANTPAGNSSDRPPPRRP